MFVVVCPPFIPPPASTQLPYTQEERIFDALAGATNNEDVNAMRDLHDADLVQLVGGFDDQCGIA